MFPTRTNGQTTRQPKTTRQPTQTERAALRAANDHDDRDDAFPIPDDSIPIPGRFNRDLIPRREFYTPRTLLRFIDAQRFARACAGRDPSLKPTRAQHIAAETGKRLYGAVLDQFDRQDLALYRLHGLGCAYGDVHRLARKLLVPLIDRCLAERRTHATVPGEIVETLADAVKARLWIEHGGVRLAA